MTHMRDSRSVERPGCTLEASRSTPQMPGRPAHIAAVVLTALSCGLGAAACGGGGPSPDEQAARARWQAGVPGWRADMRTTLNRMSLMLSDSQTRADLHRGKPRTIAQIERYEQTLEGCAD